MFLNIEKKKKVQKKKKKTHTHIEKPFTNLNIIKIGGGNKKRRYVFF